MTRRGGRSRGKTTPSRLLTEYSKYSTYQIIEIRNSLEIEFGEEIVRGLTA